MVIRLVFYMASFYFLRIKVRELYSLNERYGVIPGLRVVLGDTSRNIGIAIRTQTYLLVGRENYDIVTRHK